MGPSRDISALLNIMALLRTPGSGCPWDLQQTFSSIAPYTIEEAYEVADAIDRHALDELREELGDLLLQVVFHARMAEEQGAFDFGDVVYAITAKLLRRHPHVFAARGGLAAPLGPELWDAIKAEEKAERAALSAAQGNSPPVTQALVGVPAGLPALLRASKLQEKAATVGFDWPHATAVMAKVREEITEVEAAISLAVQTRVAGEIGDLLFAVINLARHTGTDPEAALRATNLKFERRFAAVEARLRAGGKTLAEASLVEMEAAWQASKAEEKP
jgi:ATP diphosphatase